MIYQYATLSLHGFDLFWFPLDSTFNIHQTLTVLPLRRKLVACFTQVWVRSK
jgi:hypothetical protein